jgi:predicted kinase
MSASNINHFLIGIPGSGKSTFATALAELTNSTIVSTDEIRATLYGDAAIQGNWAEIENQALHLIQQTIASGKTVIYDATNFKRLFRIDFLMKLEKKLQTKTSNPPIWIAWYIKTPLKTCKQWNQKRQRKVPIEIIESMSKSLSNFPPLIAEGFAAIEEIDITKLQPNTKEFAVQIQKRILNLQRGTINRQNRTLHQGIQFHPYSKLLDFDRLMHLISLIIQYPGIGNLQATTPNLLEKILNNKPIDNKNKSTNPIQEITAIMAKLRGSIYASEEAISRDLQWLENNNIIAGSSQLPLTNYQLPITNYQFPTHPYSDIEPFQRLIGTIRFILNHPFLPDIAGGNLPTLAQALQQAGVIQGNAIDKLRKDIEKVLKPYKILPDFPMRNGYFAGTGILSQQELIKVFEILQSQAQSLDDPLALEIYETFKQRMLQTKLIDAGKEVYPVRSIANRSIIDPRYLHSTALANHLSKLEEAIASGTLLELNKFLSSAGYEDDPKSFFLAYPLQIIFSNLAWYLGFECISGEEPGLLRFERLDRLFLGQPKNKNRSRAEQEKSLRRLQELLKGSAGLFLGNSVREQRKFLSPDEKISLQACITIELWFTNDIYKFITEGTKRFAQIKMSPPVVSINSGTQVNLPKSIFSLKKTKDKQFPNRFQAILPKWSLDDFDLWRWIVGFGSGVKVIEPPELVDKVKKIGSGIVEVYQET